jgi:alkylation response protein AidB-like acyl-CoA dehydrogenase
VSLAGAMGGHTAVAKLLVLFGTEEQKRHYLPSMATGAVRATMAVTEPGGGSDLQNMTTTALPDGADQLVVNGSKTWISNARRSGLIALLCKTDPSAQPRHKGISVLLVEHGSGLTVSRDLPKLGYKGVETCELSFDNYRALVSAILGGQAGKGFSQMMKGLETGRIQVASRALGVATAAFDDALAYAQQRESFGQPISKHQASATIWPTWRPNSPPRANSPATPPSATTAVSAATWRPGWPNCSPPKSRSRSR